MSGIRYEDRVLVVGATDTGKSTLAKRIFLSAAAPRLVVDPGDSEITGSIPGVVTFSDPNHIPRDAATSRFLPVDPADRDAYNRLYERIFRQLFPIYVWLDEPDQAAPSTGWPRWVNTTVVQGRKRMIGHLTCSTRPVHLMRSIRGSAKHVIVFDLPSRDDLRAIADDVGVPLGVLESAVHSLDEHGFAWLDRRAKALTVCPALALR